MKKTWRIVSVLLVFSLLMSTWFGISAYAISTPCVTDHFDRLITHYNEESEITYRTPPSANSCSYTAMSMLLSFYDSYWRDDFIDNTLENGLTSDWVQGIYDPLNDNLVETFNASEEIREWRDFRNSDWSNYNEFITHPDYSHYLESYLISIAKEIDLCDEDDTVFGLKGYQIVQFLEHYLYNVRGFTTDQIVVHMERAVDIGNSDATLFQQMVDHISAGFPLIYAGYDTQVDWSEIEFTNQIKDQTGGHAMIAYSLEGEENNYTDINLHTGWVGLEHTESVNNTEYTFWNVIIWLEIKNLPHSCTNAYVDANNVNISYCACQIYSTHPAHAQHHIDYRIEYTLLGHSTLCHCNTIIRTEPHIFEGKRNYYSNSQHYQTCSVCGHKEYSEHNHALKYSISDEEHATVCSCGHYGENEAHYTHRYETYTTSKHKRYCECGYYLGTAAHVLPAGLGTVKVCLDCGQTVNTMSDIILRPDAVMPSIIYITDAGSYIGADGMVYLVDSDIELYLSGELDIDALVENATGYPTV